MLYYKKEDWSSWEDVRMEIPVKFPDETEKIRAEGVAFRQLSPEEKIASILDVISLGASMMKASPNREAIERLQQLHEDAWQKVQKELFARHGL
jgi:hypothetical protein